MPNLTRRGLGGLVGTGVAAGLLSQAPAARAQATSLVVGTYGGDYQSTLESAVAAPLVRPKGIGVVYDVGSDSPRKTKLRAEARLPRGSTDVSILPGAGCYEMAQAGLLETLDETKIPNLRHVPTVLRDAHAVPHIQTFRIMLHNKDRLARPLAAFDDMWHREIAPGVGLVDIHFHYNIETAALAAGGSMTDYKPGYEKLLQLKARGARLTPTLESMGQALGSGEILVCPMWQARAVMWQKAGLPVAIAHPREGIVVNVNSFVVPKNARNKEAAYLFINAALEPAAQAAFARAMGYGPTVDNAGLDPDLARQTALPPEMANRVLIQDYGYFSSQVSQMKDWWDRTYKA